jgi:hypothetical protein
MTEIILDHKLHNCKKKSGKLQTSLKRPDYFQQYFSYIMAVSFIDGGNQSTCRKSLTNFIT